MLVNFIPSSFYGKIIFFLAPHYNITVYLVYGTPSSLFDLCYTNKPINYVLQIIIIIIIIIIQNGLYTVVLNYVIIWQERGL